MKKLESGRSMVEMLGVLAIIGVLSIGGIAGYVLSMNRYRANQGIDLANKYASVIYSSYQTYKAMHGNDTGWTAPTFDAAKLGSKPENFDFTYTVGIETYSSISDRVTVTITFPNQDICKAAGKITADNITCTKVENKEQYQANFVFTMN